MAENPSQLAEKNLGVALLSAMKDELAAVPDVWQKMSEDQQSEVLFRLSNRIEHEVGRAIVTIASSDRATAKGTLESVTVKDQAKVVIKVSRLESAVHDLIDVTGSQVLITLADPAEFIQNMGDVAPDADQPGLPLDEGDES